MCPTIKAMNVACGWNVKRLLWCGWQKNQPDNEYCGFLYLPREIVIKIIRYIDFEMLMSMDTYTMSIRYVPGYLPYFCFAIFLAKLGRLRN